MIVRPATPADLPALLALAHSAGTGLTTLPADAGRLRQRLEWAAKTFADEAERADADYLFVLENDQHEAIGICALAGAVGLREPWYNYRLGLFVAASRNLGINQQLPTLFLGNDMTGHSELCSLFLHADHRSGLNGRLLSKARFLFLAEFRQHFVQLSIGTPGEQAATYLIHNRQFAECRITAAPARVAAGTLIVDAETAKSLGLSVGSSVRAVSLAVPARQLSAA